MITYSHYRQFGNHKRAQGFVLITSAIFLVVLTLIVVYAARSAIVSERGSNNMRNRSQAFQMAEYAQRWAMNQLVVVDNLNFNDTNGYLKSTATPNIVTGSNYCVTNTDCNQLKGFNNPGNAALPDSTETAAKKAPTITGVAEQPRFIIKDLGYGDGQSSCTYYEIISRGVGFSSNSVVYLRSVVKAC